MNKYSQQFLINFVSGFLLVVAIWSGYQVNILLGKRAAIKKDYSTRKNITNGPLSVNGWRDVLVRIATNHIDDFELTLQQEDTLKFEVAKVLHAVIDKTGSLGDKNQKSVKAKFQKFAIQTFVKEDRLHEQVPLFAQTIVNKLKKPKNKDKL